MPQEKDLSKNSKAMFKAMSLALQPTQKSLDKQKVLLTHIARNSYAAKKNAEERLEEGKAEKVTADNEKKQTSFLEGIFGEAKKDKKERKGIFGFLMDNWKLIAVGIGLLLTPIRHLVAGFNWMKEYWENNTLAEMGADLATAFVVAMGLKIGAGILFNKLVTSLASAFLPEGATLATITAKELALSLLPKISVLAFIAGAGQSLWDGYKGTQLAKDWGVSDVEGALGAFIGGQGKGIANAFKNALAKGGIGMGIGLMVGGPIGAIAGGIIGAAFGAITGYIGGEQIANWIKESKEWVVKEWDNIKRSMDDIADGAVLFLRAILPEDWGKNLRTRAEREEAARRAAVGGDINQLSQEEKNQLQKDKIAQEERKKRGGAASAVAKGDIIGIESEMTAIENEMVGKEQKGGQYWTDPEYVKLGNKLATLRQDKLAILENQTKEKKKSDLSFANLKIQKNVNTAMAINPALANTVHMSGAAFKAAGHQMRITSGFRNTAAQRKAMEELRRDDPAQYEKNYKLSAKNDASTEKWLKDHISRHSTGNAVDVSYPEGIKGNKAKQEEFVNSLNSMLQKDGDGSYAVAEGHHIHINTGQKTGKMSQATFEKAFNVKMAQRANPGVGSQLGPMPQNNGNGVTNITTINKSGDTIGGGGTTLVQQPGAGDDNARAINDQTH
tara:strand:+ start:1242 stop:3257 length:2016 start_codon:yes stop_codon:yes gene_type:complete